MATPYKLKRSAVTGKRPPLADLEKGELALNFYDGNLYAERDGDGDVQSGGVGIGTKIANRHSAPIPVSESAPLGFLAIRPSSCRIVPNVPLSSDASSNGSVVADIRPPISRQGGFVDQALRRADPSVGLQLRKSSQASK